jgi:hypothetical protein
MHFMFPHVCYMPCPINITFTTLSNQYRLPIPTAIPTRLWADPQPVTAYMYKRVDRKQQKITLRSNNIPVHLFQKCNVLYFALFIYYLTT